MRRTILLLSVFVLALASCGDGTNSGKPSGDAAPSASASGSEVTRSPTGSPMPEVVLEGDFPFPPWSEVVEMYDYDTSEPLDYRVYGKDRGDGATVFNVEYQSSGNAVPAGRNS